MLCVKAGGMKLCPFIFLNCVCPIKELVNQTLKFAMQASMNGWYPCQIFEKCDWLSIFFHITCLSGTVFVLHLRYNKSKVWDVKAGYGGYKVCSGSRCFLEQTIQNYDVREIRCLDGKWHPRIHLQWNHESTILRNGVFLGKRCMVINQYEIILQIMCYQCYCWWK